MTVLPAALRELRAITFDCYGTLIDWEGGAQKTLGELLASRAGAEDPFRTEQLDDFFAAWERAQWRRIHGDYARYRDITADCFLEVARVQGLPLDAEAARAFADSIATWEPFPDTSAALGALKQRGLHLGIISNIDDDILHASVKRVGVGFDLLMTAQQARAYKPALAPFERALERLALPAAKVAHAAFGFEYDIGPAAQLGFRTILVRRTRIHFPPEPVPDLTVANLAELAARLA